jgi:hypothetical protein
VRTAEAIERRLGGDLGGLAGEGEARVVDLEGEVLGHLVLVEDGADREADLGGAPQRRALAGDRGRDAGKLALGRLEQLLALAAALGGKRRVAAQDQALAGEVRCGDGRHVAFVEQRHLESAALEQAADRRGAQRRDPVEPGRREILPDAGLGDHAAIADQDDMVEAEALLQFGDLVAESGRVAGRSLEDLDGDGTAIGGAEQAIDNLQLSLLAVAIVAALGERAAAAFQVA